MPRNGGAIGKLNSVNFAGIPLMCSCITAGYMNADPRTSKQQEHKAVWLLCLAAAIHVFIFCAAFPVFNQVDEGCHFDLVVRYSHGELPRGLQPMCRESSLYLLTYRSPEFMSRTQDFPDGHYPVPFWRQPGAAQTQAERRNAAIEKAASDWQSLEKLPVWTNYQASQPPLYYSIAGVWWRAGRWLGMTGLWLVFWLRFLNVAFVTALVWTGYRAAREVFPEQIFFTLGVPALIAFIPQQAFYSIQNDVLSPLCFGIAFIFLMRLWRAETPGLALGAATGLAMAATFLAKLTNAPLLAVSAAFIALKILRLHKGGALRRSLPALLSLVAFAAVPALAWLTRTKIAFGDWTGSAAKLQFITWTLKPLDQWLHHPIFTPHGVWTFISDLASSFWQGSEIRWHDNPLDLPAADAVYVILTLSLVILAVLSLLVRAVPMTDFQRTMLWFGLACLSAGAAFLAFLSVIYDFGLCLDPSREHPYLAEGRLILGALIPFLLIYLCGLNYLLRNLQNRLGGASALAAIILFMLASEIAADRAIFSSQYNWYHLF